MLLRQIYDDTLAQAAYLIGCQRTGEALLVDPERDIDRYLDLAAREGLRITAVCETHIHADYLSGAREVADRTGARVYVSGEGGDEWRSRWLGGYDALELRDDDTFRIGNIELRAMHTPGHTPEHVCYLVTDRAAGADEPMGLFSGDFVFVGDMGRPDLLESAAGQAGAAQTSAEALHASASRFLALPEFLQLWPAHGAGSACGKALGSVPQSTVGYEKRFNPALRAAGDRAAFMAYVLEGQPEPPLYFARMKRENRDGPALLGELPRPRELDAAGLLALDTRRTAVLDLRPWDAFRAAHLRGSLWSPPDQNMPQIAGSYIEPHEPVALVCEPHQLDWAVRTLVRIGMDGVAGWAPPGALGAALQAGPGAAASIPEITARELLERAPSGGAPVLDVRRASEFGQGRIAGALNIAHTRLAARLDEAPADDRLVVQCLGGVRSACACALLARKGLPATNLAGGLSAWLCAGGEIVE